MLFITRVSCTQTSQGARILFYVTPVWSTILETTFLKRRLTASRIMALVLGLGGLVIILGGRTGIPILQNVGDTLALLAGMVWACGSLQVRANPSVGIVETVFSFFMYGSLIALFIALLPFEAKMQPPPGLSLNASRRGWIWRQRDS